MFTYLSQMAVSLGLNTSGTRLRSFEERVGILFFSLAILFAAAHGAFAHEFKAGDIVIDHPWSRQAPTGAKVAGGYVVLENTGAEADRLIGVATDIAGKSEIHEMAVDNGVMTMRPLPDGIEIPAGGKVELKPGGLHMMFMDLKSQPAKGDKFKGTLTFEKAGTVDVEFAVEEMGARSGHEGMDHGSGSHDSGGHGSHSGHGG